MRVIYRPLRTYVVDRRLRLPPQREQLVAAHDHVDAGNEHQRGEGSAEARVVRPRRVDNGDDDQANAKDLRHNIQTIRYVATSNDQMIEE